jgi:hypothetical protein
MRPGHDARTRTYECQHEGGIVTDRNIDAQPEQGYARIKNDAANAHVSEAGRYANSYQALAYKQVFGVGADTADTILLDDDFLETLIAGRRWALSARGSADLG